MKVIYNLFTILLFVFFSINSSAQQLETIEYQVVPTAYSGTAGDRNIPWTFS